MRVIILGAGQMGAWLARELSRENTVAVCDIDREKLKGLKNVKTLSRPEEIGIFSPELLINAVNLQNTVPAFEDAVRHIPEDCIIGDVASIKGGIADYYGKSAYRFVSVHPMFGPTFADMGSPKEENAIVIKESDDEGAGFFRRFFERLGIRVFEYSFAEHDRMMAYSLTLPFISSMAFAACVDKNAVPGTTFARHMAVAKGLLSEDDHLLAEILFNPYSPAELDRVTARLEHLKHIIRGRDHEELESFFRRLRVNIA